VQVDFFSSFGVVTFSGTRCRHAVLEVSRSWSSLKHGGTPTQARDCDQRSREVGFRVDTGDQYLRINSARRAAIRRIAAGHITAALQKLEALWR
jgi:hypothetical protein